MEEKKLNANYRNRIVSSTLFFVNFASFFFLFIESKNLTKIIRATYSRYIKKEKKNKINLFLDLCYTHDFSFSC